MLADSFVMGDTFTMDVSKEYESSEMIDFMTAAEVVAEFPVFSKPSLWRWAREGKVPSILLPSKRRLFRRSDIQALLMPEGNRPVGASQIDQVLPGLERV